MGFEKNCRLKSLLDGVQVDLWSPCGVHMESVGECKVQLRHGNGVLAVGKKEGKSIDMRG